MKKCKLLAALLCGAMLLTTIPVTAFAETGGTTTKSTEGTTVFADMPTDWSTDALQKSVANGLISGYDVNGQKLIRPAGTLTRAEMGTIINNAFGATQKASLTGVTDVAADAWYYDQMAKAVQMGSFTADKQLRPEAAITRQEVATVLAKVFQLGEAKDTSLNNFSDKDSVASWAKDYVAAMVEQGYMSGNGGKLNPVSNITRAEFAAMMNNMVAQYIKTAGTYQEVAVKGNIMVTGKDLILNDVTINGNLILGDGVGDGNVTLNNVAVTGKTIVRGGGLNSIIVSGSSNLGTVVVAKADGNVRIAVQGAAVVDMIAVSDGANKVVVEGTVNKLVVSDATPVVAQKATIKTIQIDGAKANVTVDKNSKVTTLTVAKAAEAAEVTVAGSVTTIKTEAPKSAIKAEAGSKITTIEASDSAKGTNVEIAKDATVSKIDTAADITTSGGGKATDVTGKGKVDEKKPDSGSGAGAGSGSGGGGGGGTSYDTPVLKIAEVLVKNKPLAAVGGIYNIEKGVTAGDVKIDVTITGLDTATYNTSLSIKNLDNKKVVAEVNSAGIVQSYVKALSDFSHVTMGNIAAMITKGGDKATGFYYLNGKRVDVTAGTTAEDFERIIGLTYDAMEPGTQYEVNLSLAGNKTGVLSFILKKEK